MDAQITSTRRFAIIDEWILDLRVSDRAIRLYAVLARYADKDTHKAFPSRRLLADRLRCSPKSVDRAIAELVDAGLLRKEQRFNSSLVFTLTVGTPVTRGVDTGDDGGWTPVTTGVDTGDDLTITTELEPTELEPIKRATKIPKHWSPSASIKSDPRWSELDIDDQLERFRDWCLAKDTRYKDFDAAFRNWLKKALDFQHRDSHRRSEKDRSLAELDAWVEQQMKMEENK